MPEKALLSLTEAARELGVGVGAVRAAIKAGRLRTVRLARRPLIPRAALDELLNGKP